MNTGETSKTRTQSEDGAQQLSGSPRELVALEPASTGAALIARVRDTLSPGRSPRPGQLIQILRHTATTCQPTADEIQEIVGMLSDLAPAVRLQFYIRVTRVRSAKSARAGAWSRVVSALHEVNHRRTEWMDEAVVRLLSHRGALDPRLHAHAREVLRVVLADSSRWSEMLPELVFRMARKEQEAAPLLLFGILTADALLSASASAPHTDGNPAVDAIEALCTSVLRSKRRPRPPVALRAVRALLAQIDRECAGDDDILGKLAASEKNAQALSADRSEQQVRIESLLAEIALRDHRIAEQDRNLAEETSRYALLETASRSTRLDALRGLVAQIQRRTKHELGELLEAVGEPRDNRDEFIRARAQNVLLLLESEAKKVGGS